MNAELSKINSHISRCKNLHLLITSAQILFKYLIIAGISSVVLQVLFQFLPWIIVAGIWDLLLLVVAIICSGRISYNFIKAPSKCQVARILESHSSIDHPSISLALELGQNEPYSSELLNKVYQKANEQLTDLPKHIPLHDFNRKLIICFSLVITFIGITSFSSTKIISYMEYPLSLLISKPFTIEPGTLTVAKNSSVNLKLKIRDNHYPSGKLQWYSLKGDFVQQRTLRPDKDGNFVYTIDSCNRSFAYKFAIGGIESQAETVYVAQPPILEGLQISATPPAYAGLETIVFPEGQGSCEVYEGTVLRGVLHTKALRKAAVIINQDTLPMDVHGDSAIFTHTVKNQFDYTFSLIDSFGQSNDSITPFRVQLLEDLLPTIRIVQPGENRVAQESLIEQLALEAFDDIAVKSIKLNWFFSKSGSRSNSVSSKSIDFTVSRSVQTQLEWDFSGIITYPNDTIFYWASVHDGHPLSSHKVNTDTFFIRIPSFEEIVSRVHKDEQEISNTLENVKNSQEKLDTMFQSISKFSPDQKELSWDQKKMLENIQEEMENQSDSIQKALESLQERADELREKGNNEQIAKKMDEVQKALEEILKIMSDSLLARLQNKDNMSMKDLKAAIDKANEMLPNLEEHLENTLKYLEMLKKDHELALLSERAQKLSDEQSSIDPSNSERDPLEEQKATLKGIDSFKKDLEDFLKDQDSNNAQNLKLDEMKNLQSSMQSSVNKGALPSKEQRSRMGNSLKSLANDLQGMMSSAMMQRLQKDREKLLSMAAENLAMAKWAEEINKLAIDPVKNSSNSVSLQLLRDAARSNVEQIDSLQVIPPVLLQDVKEQAKKSIESIDLTLNAIRSGFGSGQNTSARNFKQNADYLLDILKQLENSQQNNQAQGQGQEGMMSGMRKLSRQQSALNNAVGELLKSLFGKKKQSGQSGEGSEASQEAAKNQARKAQQGIADELKRLNEQYGESADQSLRKRIEELEKEARAIAQMLENPSQNIADRQNKFLTRMLQATLSLNRQDKEEQEKRTSSKAKNPFAKQSEIKPSAIPKGDDTFHRIRLRAMQGNYPPNYKSAVKAYLDSLGSVLLK